MISLLSSSQSSPSSSDSSVPLPPSVQ
uniref:Uncharacterized protein n=1 Tax=Anguilla anguilla TaxID=7936 RepID=A0A0E9XWM7_ANGAN